jgi:hypothetical protein
MTFNQTTAPDGSTTADKLIDDAATGTGTVQVFQSVTVGTSTAYALSVYAKQDQLSWLNLRITNFTTPGTTNGWFDLANGVKGTIEAGYDDSGIEDAGNGWYRCWVTFTTDATDTTGNLRIQCVDADQSTTAALDGTSSIFVWGAMFEAGSKPSPYIRTTTGTVTANADNVTGTLSGEIGTGPVAFYIRFKKQDTFDGNRYLYYLDDGSTTDRYHSFVERLHWIQRPKQRQVSTKTTVYNTLMAARPDQRQVAHCWAMLPREFHWVFRRLH